MTAKRSKKWTTLQLAKAIARLADEKLAEKIVLLDVGQAIQVADYFVIGEGKNGRHMNTVAEFVASELKKDGIYRMGGSTLTDENWVLLDFGPVVLHMFSTKARGYYDLENLWGDCKRLRWQAPVRKPKAAAEPAPEASV
jgi:ribosome-associated protein